MTDKINHAANQYVKEIFPGYKGDDLEGGTKDAFIDGATSEAAREYWEGQGWVRAEDGLPQKGERVFICTDNWVCACCYINVHDEWKLAYDSSLFHGNITHWRPLPAPPNQ